MINLNLISGIKCHARSKVLTKKRWEINIQNLALISLETQTKFTLKPKTLSFDLQIIKNPEMQRLNFEYRNINKSTDVLSFPAWDQSFPNLNLQFISLGDIFICQNKIEEQAFDYGHSIEREAAFLFVHGFLHLLGYDHETKNDEEEMFNLQKLILEKTKFKRIIPIL